MTRPRRWPLRRGGAFGRLQGWGDAGSGGALAGAAALAIAVAGAGVLLGVGVPEKVECLVSPVVGLSAAGTTTPGDSGGDGGGGGGGEAAQCATGDGAGAGADGGEGRGFSARTLADTDSAPAKRPDAVTAQDLLGRAFPGERCAAALTGASEPTILCATGGAGEPTGSTTLERCAAGEGPGSLLCHETAADARPAIDTSAAAGQTAWCQPVHIPATTGYGEYDDVPVEWACASYAGDVFFCAGGVQRWILDGRTSTGLRADPAWAADRANWPTTCDSRTLADPTWADCATPENDATTGCTVPQYAHAGPARDITCLQLPGTPDEAQTSHIIGKPLHCTTRPPAPRGAGTCPTPSSGLQGGGRWPTAGDSGPWCDVALLDPRPGSGRWVGRSTGVPWEGSDARYTVGDREAVDRLLEEVADHADTVLRVLRCSTGISGTDGRGRAVQVVTGAPLEELVGQGVVALAEPEESGVILGRRPGARGALAHEVVHDITSGLGVFPPRPPVSPGPDDHEAHTLTEGFSTWMAARLEEKNADQFLRDPVLDDLAADNRESRDSLEGQYPRYSRDVFAAEGSPHAKGYLVVEVAKALERLAPQAPPRPAGCDHTDPVSRWWAASLPALAAGQPSWVGWCDAMAASAHGFGVTADATHRAFRSFGVPCGP